jgi:hypothetical protein
MAHIAERLRHLLSQLESSRTRTPFHARILQDHMDPPAELSPLNPDEHYFQIRINEMFLYDSRRWFVEYSPMVFCVTEFVYDKKMLAVPFVVGPQMLERFRQKLPQGMLFTNTRVAGPHPYRGSRLINTFVLCQVKQEDYAQKLLGVVEKIGGVLDVACALGTYTKVAEGLVDGVEALLGLKDTVDPLIGWRHEFDPDAGDRLEPSYFVLIDGQSDDADRPPIDISQLWVKEGRLFKGDSGPQEEFRDADYLLYSIVKSSRRGDVTSLPFYPLFERAKQEASVPDDNSWIRARSDMLSLYQTLILSPDLTRPHADELGSQYHAELKNVHRQAAKYGSVVMPDMTDDATLQRKLRESVVIVGQA